MMRYFIYGARFEPGDRSEEHTSELQSQSHLVCRLLLEKKKQRCGKLPAVSPHATIIDHKNGNAIPHQHLVKETSSTAPFVLHALPLRTALRIAYQLNFF